jgi:hypothetical protein
MDNISQFQLLTTSLQFALWTLLVQFELWKIAMLFDFYSHITINLIHAALENEKTVLAKIQIMKNFVKLRFYQGSNISRQSRIIELYDSDQEANKNLTPGP